MQDPLSQSSKHCLETLDFCKMYTTVRNVGRLLFQLGASCQLVQTIVHHHDVELHLSPQHPCLIVWAVTFAEGQWGELNAVVSFKALTKLPELGVLHSDSCWLMVLREFFLVISFFKEVISFTKGKYFFMQDIIKLEFIATGCCGCQKLRQVQKAIKQIHGSEVHRGQLSTKIQSLAQEVLSHSLLEAGRGEALWYASTILRHPPSICCQPLSGAGYWAPWTFGLTRSGGYIHLLCFSQDVRHPSFAKEMLTACRDVSDPSESLSCVFFFFCQQKAESRPGLLMARRAGLTSKGGEQWGRK